MIQRWLGNFTLSSVNRHEKTTADPQVRRTSKHEVDEYVDEKQILEAREAG